jgi:hypothetical protein
MKGLIFCIGISLAVFIWLPGCGAEVTAGGVGLGVGAGLSETFAGMQADLERREQELIDRYNALHAAGATAEDLADVERQLEQTVQLRQGVQTGEHLLGVDWTDPATAGGAIGMVAALAWSIFSKRKLNQKYVSAKAGQARLKTVNPEAEKDLYAFIGQERTTRGL